MIRLAALMSRDVILVFLMLVRRRYGITRPEWALFASPAQRHERQQCGRQAGMSPLPAAAAFLPVCPRTSAVRIGHR